MTDHLSLRYDGPVPLRAAVPADHAELWSVQYGNRRRWAWLAVRRIGHQVAHESRMARELNSIVHLKEWKRLRAKDLAPVIETYKKWRDWERAAVAREE